MAYCVVFSCLLLSLMRFVLSRLSNSDGHEIESEMQMLTRRDAGDNDDERFLTLCLSLL